MTSQVVTFAPTVTSQVVMVPIISDNVVENDELFTAELSVPGVRSGVMLGANRVTVEIADDDREYINILHLNIQGLYPVST